MLFWTSESHCLGTEAITRLKRLGLLVIVESKWIYLYKHGDNFFILGLIGNLRNIIN